MEDFNVIIDSLGNTSLSFLGSAGVTMIRIFPNRTDQSAHMEIALEQDTWDKRTRAIHSMVEIREMFLDDLSLDYCFVPDETTGCASGSRVDSREFAAA